jgi:hypothetical protein
LPARGRLAASGELTDMRLQGHRLGAGDVAWTPAWPGVGARVRRVQRIGDRRFH